MLPQKVPRERIGRCPMCRATRGINAESAPPATGASKRACRASAPMRNSPPSSPCMARRSSASSTVRGAKYLNETGFIGDGGSRTGAVCSLSQFFGELRERALVEQECLVTRRPVSLRHQLVHVVTHL